MANTITAKIGKTCELSVFENSLKGDNKKFVPITIIIGNYLYIKPNMVKSKEGSWFVSYPSYKDKDGKYINTVFAKKEFTDAIIKAFEKILKDNTPETLPKDINISGCEDLPF